MVNFGKTGTPRDGLAVVKAIADPGTHLLKSYELQQCSSGV